MQLWDELSGSTPIPLSNAHDVRVSLQYYLQAEKQIGAMSVCFDKAAIRELFTDSDNWFAACVRAAILISAVRTGLLDRWENEAFLERTAAYPLPGGLEQLRLEDFAAFLCG